VATSSSNPLRTANKQSNSANNQVKFKQCWALYLYKIYDSRGDNKSDNNVKHDKLNKNGY